uniref:No apical meristem-associated C-terminal domain-containing protein n=1 Tax=Tanacetum cinerariifolium TaxID=118510 RepID=A0A699GYI6_TANCI|nr:hypothetical protein [Tanacetum cinerariifolium]
MFNKKTLKSKTPKSQIQESVPHSTPDLNFQLSGVSPPMCFRSSVTNWIVSSYYEFIDVFSSKSTFSPLNHVTLDMDSEQLISAYGSAPVDDDYSPVEDMSLVKAKNPSKRASKDKKKDTKEIEPPQKTRQRRKRSRCVKLGAMCQKIARKETEAARRETAELKREKLGIQRRTLELAGKKWDKDILFYNSEINFSFPQLQKQKLQEMNDEINEQYT